jgi:competence protein ComEC
VPAFPGERRAIRGDAPRAVAGAAIELMLRIARAAAAAPHATLLIPSAPGWTLPTAFLGILWLCLWRGPLRWAGLPLAMAVSLAPRGPVPDVWVASDGAAVAVRAGGEAILLRPDVKLFGPQFWAQRRALAIRGDGQAARDAAFLCDRWSCLAKANGPAPSVAAVWSRKPVSAARAAALCASADLVVVRGEAAPADCAGALMLSHRDFVRGGSAELYRTQTGWRVVWAQELRGRRPWSLFSGSGE